MPSSFWFDFDALDDLDGSDALDDISHRADSDEATDGQTPQHGFLGADANVQKKETIHENKDQPSLSTDSNSSSILAVINENGDTRDGRSSSIVATNEVDNPVVFSSSEEHDHHALVSVQRRPSLEPTMSSENLVVSHGGREVGLNRCVSSQTFHDLNLDGRFKGERVAGNAEERRTEKQLSQCQFFDWDLLPDIVLSQRDRDAKEVATAQTLSRKATDKYDDVWICRDAEGHPLGKCENCRRCDSYNTHPAWASQVQTALVRFRATGINTEMQRPASSYLPVDALQWEPADVALHVLTYGVFDPRRDRRPEGLEGVGWYKEEQERAKAENRPLVSIITPTSSSRQEFHPLLYECFRTQQYEPKELIVVETGDTPSQFLQDTARQDPRIVYRFWPVDDARMQDMAGPYGMVRRGKHVDWLVDRLRGQVRGGRRRMGWTLGMKRNIACHLSRGDVIAHFDDDDLYAPMYLTQMVVQLQKAAKSRPANESLPAAAVTLEAWHVVDLFDQTFGFYAPLRESMMDWGSETCKWREAIAYGFGFSYVYSKAAWDLKAFADVEWSEDGDFVQFLKKKKCPVRLVNPRFLAIGINAVAAHSYHRDNTSGGEFRNVNYTEHGTKQRLTSRVRMGEYVHTPNEFSGLLPLLRNIVSAKNLTSGEQYPLRQLFSKYQSGCHVDFSNKEDFMKKYGAGLSHTFPWRRACEHGDDKSKANAISKRTALSKAWDQGEYQKTFNITMAGYRATIVNEDARSSETLQKSALPKLESLPPGYNASDPQHAEIRRQVEQDTSRSKGTYQEIKRQRDLEIARRKNKEKDSASKHVLAPTVGKESPPLAPKLDLSFARDQTASQSMDKLWYQKIRRQREMEIMRKTHREV